MKKILIIGSGGREHTLAWKLANDRKVEKVYCLPGNGGTKSIAENVNIEINNFNNIHDYVISENIDMIVVGPEGPLNDGIVDFFQERNISIFGPDKFASQLESSKLFARDFMKNNNIPQPEYYECQNIEDAYKIKSKLDFPLVLKADGLAGGKGVIICNSEEDFTLGINIMFTDKKFGSASERISIEECLIGEELSIFAACDGENFKILGNAQDHKRVFDGDKGPNTGGMGAYSPTKICTQDLLKSVEENIIKPTLKGMNQLGHPYTGFLYVGLMIVDNKPFVIEFNVRMGDPETQVVIPQIKSSLYDILEACLRGSINNLNINFQSKTFVTVVLASEGYPEEYNTGQFIDEIQISNNSLLFHAGTIFKNKKYIVSGGRVLNAVGFGDSLSDAIDNAYNFVERIQFPGIYYRKDIGHKGLR